MTFPVKQQVDRHMATWANGHLAQGKQVGTNINRNYHVPRAALTVRREFQADFQFIHFSPSPTPVFVVSLCPFFFF